LSTSTLSHLKKIGILGGTFDPPHIGHLKLASHFAKLLNLDALLLIPSGEPWQKGSGITSAEVRLRLTEAAGIDLARAFLYLKIPTQVGIDRIEVDRAGPSYAIDTAKALRERFGPETSLIWLMGADSLNALPTWHAWKELTDYVHLAVASRPNHELAIEANSAIQDLLAKYQTKNINALEKSASGLIYIDETLAVDLSSTALRRHLQTSNQSPELSEQIPSHTLEMITKLGLYQ
jgi:nicotinate-nucleotide adenylyltransferase